VNKRKLFSSAFLVVCLVVIVFVKFYNIKSINDIPDPIEVQEIISVVNRAYQVMEDASRTSDVSEFPSVFVDTQDYKLTDEQQEAMARDLGINVADVKNTGYLTAMQTEFISRGRGASLLQAALDKAKAENRKLNVEEFQEVIKANHGQVPSSLGNLTINKTVITFELIEIEGNKAIVKYDDGAALQQAILVKRTGRWLIASIVPIWIHY
jgi:hypothetical protein